MLKSSLSVKKFFILLLVFTAAVVAPLAISADHTSSHTIEQIRAQIAALQVKLAALLKEQETSPEWCHTFNVSLGVGAKGEEIAALEHALALEGFAVEPSSNFAPVFNKTVASAVIGFQQKYRDEVLKPAGLVYGTGFVGRFTRTKLNALYGCKKPVSLHPPPPPVIPPPIQPLPPPPPPPVAAGPSVKILPSSSQPVATPAVRGAIVSFANITVSPESPVVLQEMTIDRTGLGDDQAFREVALIARPSAGIETANDDRIVAWGALEPSSHRVSLKPTEALGRINGPAEFTVAGIMASDLSNYAGQVSYLSVAGAKFISQTGSVQAVVPLENFPIQGTAQTTNNSLAIGELSVKTVNDINSGRRMDFRASAAEDIRLYKIILQSSGGNISIEGVPYNCWAADIYEVCDLGTGVTIPKGTTIKVTPKSGNFVTPSPYNVLAYGKTHGYRLMPVIIAETASAQNKNLASVFAGLRAQLELLSKALQLLK